MSAIQPIDVATPNRAMPAPVSPGPGDAEPGQPFAEVMRSTVSPTQTAQKSSYPSDTSASSRPQFHRPDISAETQSNRANAPVSTSPSQAGNVNAAIQTGGIDGENVDSSAAAPSSSTDLKGAATSLVDGQTQASISSATVGDRLSEVTPQRARATDTEARSSPAENGWKPTSSAKGENKSQDASGSSTAVTTTSIAVASVPGRVLPNLPVVNPPAAPQAGSSAATESKYGTKLDEARAQAKDSSFSIPTTASALAARIPQADEVTGIAGTLSHGTQIGDEKQGVNSNLAANANTTATSAANQNGVYQGSDGSQPASVADGISAHASANGISGSLADATPSNAASTNGIGNPDSIGNDPVESAGNGAVTSVHGNTGLKSSDFTVAMPTLATTAKDLPNPHATPVDSGVGLQNGSPLFSSGNHLPAPGSFSLSTAGSTATRVTTADAFIAMDGATSGERGVLLHAAPHQVAVGVSDPSLGWVEVRAERVSGQIAAALTTNSASSHAALTSVLPTMATYLQEHHAGVQQVHVESSLTGGQAGAGSQGQTASQSDGQTSSDKTATASSAGYAWNAAPIARAAIPASQETNLVYEGHRFSIRA